MLATPSWNWSASALEEARGLAGMPAKPAVPSAGGFFIVGIGRCFWSSGLVKLDPRIAKLVEPDRRRVFAVCTFRGPRAAHALGRLAEAGSRFAIALHPGWQHWPCSRAMPAVVPGGRSRGECRHQANPATPRPQAGDYAVQSEVVSLGAADVALEIRELVKPLSHGLLVPSARRLRLRLHGAVHPVRQKITHQSSASKLAEACAKWHGRAGLLAPGD